MSRLCLASFFLLAVVGCTKPEEVDPFPPFVDDCDEGDNDEFDDLSGLEAEDGVYYEAELCRGDLDYYRFDIPPGSHVQVELIIDGSGAGETDLDLWEIEDPNNPVDPRLDMVSGEEGDDNVLWSSGTEQDYERLAWYNPTDEPWSRYIVVDGYEDAVADYELEFQVEDFDEGLDCDYFEGDTSEEGPCNRILQFPQANTVDDGYLVSHEAHYSNLRREVAYLVRYAAAETASAFPDTNPLGLLDMSQRDGDVPGRMRGQLRHPEGTHVNGNDIDIAYYQTGDDNLGRAVCTQHDNYFCTGPANLLDARRTAFFMAKLMESPNVRVIGVDPEIATDVNAAASDLRDEGLLSASDTQRLNTYMAYGDGWPFHHHHMHFSWDWEDGWGGRSQRLVEGCRHDELNEPAGKQRIEPGR